MTRAQEFAKTALSTRERIRKEGVTHQVDMLYEALMGQVEEAVNQGSISLKGTVELDPQEHTDVPSLYTQLYLRLISDGFMKPSIIIEKVGLNRSYFTIAFQLPIDERVAGLDSAANINCGQS
jgi:hypothetical protein